MSHDHDDDMHECQHEFLEPMMTSIDAQMLRDPFPKDLIEYKEMAGKQFAYVNHALVTDRLISVDPSWTWEPMGVTDQGMPVMDLHGGLWIRMMVLGVSRIGYGASDPHQKGGDAIKTAISDAIKNAAMRFGVALDQWGADPSQEPALAVVRSIQTDPDESLWETEEPSSDEETSVAGGACEHGLRLFRKAPDGKWAAYFCPDKLPECRPLDARTGKLWPAKK